MDWLHTTICHFLADIDARVSEFPSSDEVVRTVVNGGVYLVPYDSAKDFGPCDNNGKSAHWCAITGVFLLDQNTQTIEALDAHPVEIEQSLVYLVGYQGKSR